MNLIDLLPWSFRGLNPFLNTYGDRYLFRKIIKTRPIVTNPDAETEVHSAVPHRYVYAYLVAIKSLLQYYADLSIVVHDDGSLNQADKDLISQHLPHCRIIERTQANKDFDSLNNPFLSKVRNSYTSYIKLFDTSYSSQSKRVIIVDTDTLFLKRPDQIIEWATKGGKPWYHLAPKGKMKIKEKVTTSSDSKTSSDADTEKDHIQTLIMKNLDDINATLNANYSIEQGFCSGFIGYDSTAIELDELDKLFSLLYEKFGDKIFKWGSEQTTHGLLLCSKGAEALPIDDYFVFTQMNADRAKDGTFVHFVGENRFHRLIYPKLANKIINGLP